MAGVCQRRQGRTSGMCWLEVAVRSAAHQAVPTL